MMQAILALEDGTILKGKATGIEGITVGELVFNTAMTGYQEVLTDPSYAKQIITFTSPHIGNTGINPEDYESLSNKIWASGLVVRECSSNTTNWRATQSFTEWLKDQNIVGISGINTRALTTLIRDKGAMKCCIMAGDYVDQSKAIDAAKGFSGLEGVDLTELVTVKEPYRYVEAKKNKEIIVLDLGVKKSILQCLINMGYGVTVVPACTKAEAILELNPHGILLSNGPGDPAAGYNIISNIKQLITTSIPILGICLGYQLLALAFGAKTYKMKFGHHGINHPIQDIKTSEVVITAQNHNFAVDEDSLVPELVATHRSLFDNSLQGIAHVTKPIYGLQGHPEASPGPHDLIAIFEKVYA